MHAEAFHGKVGNKEEYYAYVKERSTKSLVYKLNKLDLPTPKFRPADNTFVELKYKKVTLPNNEIALMVELKVFNRLPAEEQMHWMKYKIEKY